MTRQQIIQERAEGFMNCQRIMSRRVQEAIADARKRKRSIEDAVLEVINDQRYMLEAENAGYQPEKHGPKLTEITIAMMVTVVCVIVFLMATGVM